MQEEIFVERVDEGTCMICLEVPGPKIVLLQAFFELYEGAGTVRTLDARRSLVCVLTPPSMLDHCLAVLRAVRERVPWRAAAALSDDDKKRYLGYARRGGSRPLARSETVVQ